MCGRECAQRFAWSKEQGVTRRIQFRPVFWPIGPRLVSAVSKRAQRAVPPVTSAFFARVYHGQDRPSKEDTSTSLTYPASHKMTSPAQTNQATTREGLFRRQLHFSTHSSNVGRHDTPGGEFWHRRECLFSSARNAAMINLHSLTFQLCVCLITSKREREESGSVVVVKGACQCEASVS